MLPRYTSLKGYRGSTGFNSATYYAFWDVGVNWSEEGQIHHLMSLYGGVIGGAFYSGIYDWAGARSDLQSAEHVKKEFQLTYRQVMGVWLDTHYLIEEHSDLLQEASEKLCKDKVMGWEYWEEVLFRNKISA